VSPDKLVIVPKDLILVFLPPNFFVSLDITCLFFSKWAELTDQREAKRFLNQESMEEAFVYLQVLTQGFDSKSNISFIIAFLHSKYDESYSEMFDEIIAKNMEHTTFAGFLVKMLALLLFQLPFILICRDCRIGAKIVVVDVI
jgi:hypothetical protein